MTLTAYKRYGIISSTYVRHDVYNVICFAIFDASEVFQSDGGENIDEIVWSLKKFVQVGVVFKSQKICGELC